jgi:hypothetical protein
VGLHKLLADFDRTISLVPENNERHGRRSDDADETVSKVSPAGSS